MPATFSGATTEAFSWSADAAPFKIEYSSAVIVPLSTNTFNKSKRASLEALADIARVAKVRNTDEINNAKRFLIKLTVISPDLFSCLLTMQLKKQHSGFLITYFYYPTKIFNFYDIFMTHDKS